MSNPVLAVIAGGGCRQIEAATGMLQALEAAGIRIDRYNASAPEHVSPLFTHRGFPAPGWKN